MLFTNIQLDDFTGTLPRFLERLEMEGEGVEEREGVMMGITNLGAVLEYGRASSVVRRAGGFGGVKEGTDLGSAGVDVVVKRATAHGGRRNEDGYRRWPGSQSGCCGAGLS
jgi:protein SMG6